MDDEFLKVATPFLTKLLSETFDATKIAIKRGTEFIRKKDFLGRTATKYSIQLIERYGSIRVLGSNKPVPLDYLYTQVKCCQQIARRQSRDLSELYDRYSLTDRKINIDYEVKSADDIVDQQNKLVLLGQPGSGKTTFLKYTALRFARGLSNKKQIPIIISLKELSEQESNVCDYIVSQFHNFGIDAAELIAESMLRRGICLVMFDGLDEVNTDRRDQVIRNVKYFSTKYSRNSFIISCRTADYNYYFEDFVDVEVADLSEDQIEHYIHSWFGDNFGKAKECVEAVLRDAPINELARLPLSLSMLCLHFDLNFGFPRNRAELYMQTLDALLGQWDSVKSIKRDEIYKNLSRKRKEGFFSRLAAKTFENNQYYYSQAFLENEISRYLSNLPGVQQDSDEIDGESVLKAIEVQHGIIIERARGIYSFSHLSFQEFYASRYIINNVDDRLLSSMIKGHLFDSKWQEVFTLVASGLDEADKYFHFLKEEINNRYFQSQEAYELIRQIYLHSVTQMRIAIASPLVLSACIYDILDQYTYLLFEGDNTIQGGGSLGIATSVQMYAKWIMKLLMPKGIRYIPSRVTEMELGDSDGCGFFLIDSPVDRIPLPVPLSIETVLDIDNKESLNALHDIVYGNYILVRGLLSESYLEKGLREEMLEKILIPPT